MALKELLEASKELLARDKNVLYIFDLDSTIFDLTNRQLQIFREFANEEKYQKMFPEECNAFAYMNENHMSYYPEDCIHNFGVEKISSSFQEHFYPFWEVRFFSNEYCEYDIPEKDSLKYIQSIYDLGGHIHYLTGRDEARMGIGTRKSLKDHGFILNDNCERIKIKLKPEKSIPDANFKKEYVDSFAEDFDKIVFIDNEPANLEILTGEYPHLRLVHFDTYHMGKHKVPEEALVVKTFDH